MRIKIVSNHSDLANVQTSPTQNFVPSIGDELIWEGMNDVGTYRGKVKERIVDYTVPPRFEVVVTLVMEDTWRVE